MFVPLRVVSPEPMPDMIPEAVNAATLTVPVNVGVAERTTLPVPVLDVTPVPPRSTGNVPDDMFVALNNVTFEPTPANVVADTAPKTSRVVDGVVTPPIPTFPPSAMRSTGTVVLTSLSKKSAITPVVLDPV